jgi:hypothetical protein
LQYGGISIIIFGLSRFLPSFLRSTHSKDVIVAMH